MLTPDEHRSRARASTPSPSPAASRWPRWPSPGCSAAARHLGADRGPAEQVADAVAALKHADFTTDELAEIDRYAVDSGVNLWAASSERA